MKKIAVFGKPGGGKSTLSKTLSRSTGIPLHPLDLIEFNPDGSRVDDETFSQCHRVLIQAEEWIIDGVGTPNSFSERLKEADTLIYIDLPYFVHYWWVVKRFLASPFKAPEGWPKGSDVLKGTITSINTLRLCPAYWNKKFVDDLHANHAGKKIFVIKSVSELNAVTKDECESFT